MVEENKPEIIESDEVIGTGDVVESKGEMIRIFGSVGLAAASLVIASVILVIAAVYGKTELQTWATSVVSAIAGAAIAYGFNGRGN